MFFQVYGANAGYQWLGMLLVLVCLILLNEFTRRSKFGGITMLLVVPAILTIYYVVLNVGAAAGAEWALNNPTITNMNSWFHYAKLYAALAGCIGFMLIRYQWGIGKQKWFRIYPFLILSINILIAVASDFESAIKGWYQWWISSEGVGLYGGWHNIMNGVAGILNIIGITGWLGIYASKDKRDMLWPDMIWIYIVAYDIWNFAYTYNCLPTHSWYCGVALLLAPTIAAFFWTKGAWLANRAHTLAIWCMFAQTFPLFQDTAPFLTLSAQYVDGVIAPAANAAVNAVPMTVVSALALVANLVLCVVVFVRAAKAKKNPYTNEIFTDTKDYQKAMARVGSAE
ncbi:MAG: DUF5692 family protein [Bacillota bacterium]|jgi:hypothetical protein